VATPALHHIISADTVQLNQIACAKFAAQNCTEQPLDDSPKSMLAGNNAA
jgi:hypothetical protein